VAAALAGTGIGAAVTAAISTAAAALAPAIAVVIAAGIAVTLVTSLFSAIMSTFVASSSSGSGGKAFAEFLLKESQTGDASGDKYNDFAHEESGTFWCSSFIWYCWDMSGMSQAMGTPADSGLYVPRANSWIMWPDRDPSKGSLIKYNSNYVPQPGDILVYGEYSYNVSHHVGAVGAVNENGSYMRCEGNALGCNAEYPGQGEWTWVFRPNFPQSGSGEKAINGESGWLSFMEFMYLGVSDRYGWHYTYYSETVLPGGGLNIPGRHVEDGCVCDADGYVVVACDTLPYGSIVPTPMRDGKVYDCGVYNPIGIAVYVHYP